MAKIQKKPQENHDNDWLNTYADMVTLLLTFFVMLYASSSIDDQKWQYIYQAFQSRGKYLNEYVDSPEHTTEQGNFIKDEVDEGAAGQGTLPQSFDQLYVYLSEYVEDEQLSDAVSVSKDSAHIYIRFDSNVFFDGNSADLKQAGKDIIDGILPGLGAVKESILRVTVSGHTAEGISPVNDWELSSDRAVSVVKYMDYKTVLESEQFRTSGVGPYEPVADNSTEEGRAANRRVELVILRNDLDLTDPQVIQDILANDYGLFNDVTDPGAPSTDEGKLPNDSAQGVIDMIESLFPSTSTVSPSTDGATGPVIYDEFESFIKAEEEADADSAASTAAADASAAEDDASAAE